MWACKNGHKDVVKLLLDNLNARNVFGTTAFMQAWFNGHKDVVKLILKYSEVVNINIPESFK